MLILNVSRLRLLSFWMAKEKAKHFTGNPNETTTTTNEKIAGVGALVHRPTIYNTTIGGHHDSRSSHSFLPRISKRSEKQIQLLSGVLRLSVSLRAGTLNGEGEKLLNAKEIGSHHI